MRICVSWLEETSQILPTGLFKPLRPQFQKPDAPFLFKVEIQTTAGERSATETHSC